MYPPVSLEAPGSSSPDHHLDCLYKEVVIVGNGPSAISLSYILCGNWPYYGVESVHPLDFLHRRLAANRSTSILMQELRSLCDGLEGRSDNPVSVLFDTLNHPDTDLGVDVNSCLSWLHHPERRVDHVVIGRGLPGGSWQDMEQSALTLSLEPWMDMPGYRYKDWEKERLRDRRECSSLKRASVGHVARYYRDFVVTQKLESNFRNHSVVTSVRKLSEEEACKHTALSHHGQHWEVQGQCTWSQLPFRYITPHVVLATGSYDRPNRLEVAGEDLPYVWHYASQLEKYIMEEGLGPQSDPVMIVGAGLTAADAIITARFLGVPVAHVFRRDVNDPALIFNRLPENMYPDYHKIHQMMRQSDGGGGESRSYRGYHSYPQSRPVEMLANHKVRIQQGVESSVVLKVSLVLVLIGSKPDLSILSEEVLSSLRGQMTIGRELVRVDAFTHESLVHQGLFAMGPLVGDNFVRFLQGGALAIASHLAQRSVVAEVRVKCSVEEEAEADETEETMRHPLQWGRVLSCPEGIQMMEAAAAAESGAESSELEQTIEMLQRRCRFRSKRRQQQAARRRRASHSSCDKLSSAH